MFKKAKKELDLKELESILALMKKYQITQIEVEGITVTKNIHLDESVPEEKKDDLDDDDLLFHSAQ